MAPELDLIASPDTVGIRQSILASIDDRISLGWEAGTRNPAGPRLEAVEAASFGEDAAGIGEDGTPSGGRSMFLTPI